MIAEEILESKIGQQENRRMFMSIFHPEDDEDLKDAELDGEKVYVAKLFEVWLKTHKKLTEKFLEWALDHIRHSSLRHKIDAENLLLATYYKK